MTISQNGWTASPERVSIGIKNFMVAGSTQHLACATAAAPLLVHFAEWFHAEIEPIDVGTFDDWGYHYATIPGQSALSNHASGTAIDLNATKHPWKAVKSGFTTVQETKIRAKCKEMGLRWGFDYVHGWKDPMHYEVVITPPQVAALVQKLKLTMPKEMK